MQPYSSPPPGGAPQWNNNPPASQPPQGWSPTAPNGHYTPRPNQSIPPISQAIPQPGVMQTLQPNHPEQYRALPAPHQMYAPPYPHPQMGYPPPQQAPRQRTAIACRYCRRRKIRCSGFDQNEEGRCSNCVRFNQECVFTPVHAQAQAFVPAHSVYRGQNLPPNTQLYGAYGQPLPPNGDRGQQPPQHHPPGQYPPPPQGYQQPPMYGQPPPHPQTGDKRPSDEPHTPTMPPPAPGQQAQMGQAGPVAYAYPAPGQFPTGASPASSHPSLNTPQYPPQAYYAPSAPYARHASPQGAYPYEAPSMQQQQAQAQAAQALATQDGRTTTDSKQGDSTNAATSATPDTARVTSTRDNGVDVGVQVNLLDELTKEPDS